MDHISIMEASVAKWNRILAGERSDGGVLDCPPCRIYYMLVCTGCPIATFTGHKFCKGSPYPAWFHHQNEVHGFMRRKIYCDECRRLATAMRDFMIEIVEDLKARKAAREEPAEATPQKGDGG
ncbi:MAG: hypothetical protein PVI27_08060 [Desulfobacteraceae bacterium]|jgi:hypothetical protein